MERRTTIYGWLTRRILRRDEDLAVNECVDDVRSADAFADRVTYFTTETASEGYTVHIRHRHGPLDCSDKSIFGIRCGLFPCLGAPRGPSP